MKKNHTCRFMKFSPQPLHLRYCRCIGWYCGVRKDEGPSTFPPAYTTTENAPFCKRNRQGATIFKRQPNMPNASILKPDFWTAFFLLDSSMGKIWKKYVTLQIPEIFVKSFGVGVLLLYMGDSNFSNTRQMIHDKLGANWDCIFKFATCKEVKLHGLSPSKAGIRILAEDFVSTFESWQNQRVLSCANLLLNWQAGNPLRPSIWSW